MQLSEQIKEIYLNGKYDSIISLGGGIVADVAKLANLAVSVKAADARKLSPETPISSHLGPLVVVPTAEATGLETSHYASLNRKMFCSVWLMPNLVVLDPRLTRACDSKIIAEAGLAALGRTLEASVSENRNPFMDAYSYAAVCFIRENLVGAVSKCCDKKAALAVANAAAMSGCVVSNSDPGVLYRLGQIFQNVLHVHPGVIIGMCLKAFLEDCVKKDKNALSLILLPLAGEDRYAATPADKRTEEALKALRGLFDELYGALKGKVPRTISEAGIQQFLMDDLFEVINKEPDGAYLRTLVERAGGSVKS